MVANFFTPLGVMLFLFLPVTSLHVDFPAFSFNYFAAIPAVFGLISFCGCIVSLSLEKKQSQYWYWGIPLCIAITVVIIASFLFLAGIQFIGWNALQSFILLTLCTALLLYPEEKAYSCSRGVVVISLIVSILSAILLWGLIFPHNYAPLERVLMNPFELLFWVYYLLGLPVVGALFLARAFGFLHPVAVKGAKKNF